MIAIASGPHATNEGFDMYLLSSKYDTRTFPVLVHEVRCELTAQAMRGLHGEGRGRQMTRRSQTIGSRIFTYIVLMTDKADSSLVFDLVVLGACVLRLLHELYVRSTSECAFFAG